MKLFKKILTWTIIITISLNIGRGLATHYYYHVFYTTPDTFFDKALAGGWEILSKPEMPIERRSSLLGDQMLFSIFWPFIIVIVGVSWLLYFLWEILIVTVIWEFLICTVIWGLLKFLAWVIFMGGGALLAQKFFAHEAAWAIGFLIISLSFAYYQEETTSLRGNRDENKIKIEKVTKRSWHAAILGAIIILIALMVKWL
ncbi:MAG: hypothetical protein QMD50_00240 [Patescibacteria group bacterium]|nr:hypothetical protein [Patescibacteria group bacterium]